MRLTEQIAKHVRDLHFGGSFTGSSFRENLAGVTWQQATTPVHSLNTIATLVFHANYYVSAVVRVLEGGPLDAHDKYSFDCPPIQSQEDWDMLLEKTWADAERFAELVEQLPDTALQEDFAEGKYGNSFRNFFGLSEHTHYHLGQIALIKRILQDPEAQ